MRFRPDVIALKPRVVVILAGTNDIAGNTGPMTNEEIQNNLASMSRAGEGEQHQRGAVEHHARSARTTCAEPAVVPQTTRRPVARIKALNEWMKSYAAANKHVYLDYYSAMIDSTGHVEGGVQRGRSASERGRATR